MRRKKKGPVYRGRTRADGPKSIKRAAAAAVVLLILCLVVGTAYTFFNGNRPITDKPPTTTPVEDTYRAIKPVKPRANAAVGVAVEAFSSLAQIGSEASISIRTTPSATCKIAVLYNKLPAHEAGLEPQIADDFGSVTWTWTITPDTPVGMWPIDITCANHSHSGFVEANLDVSS